MILLDENLINKHSSLQWRDVGKFLSLIKQMLGWVDLTGETIVDVGSGPGHNSTQQLLRQFPNVGKIIAMDGSEDMIRLGKSTNPHSKVEYVVAEIQDKSILQTFRECASKLFSAYCIHWVMSDQEQVQAFRNIYDLLTPGGEAAVLFCSDGANYEAMEDMREHPKWKMMTKDLPSGIPISQSHNLDEHHYRRIMTEVGFEIIRCQKDPTIFTFPSDEECKGHLGSICSMLKDIPEHLRSDFIDSMFESFVVRCGRSPEGLPNMLYNCMSILIRKPFQAKSVQESQADSTRIT